MGASPDAGRGPDSLPSGAAARAELPGVLLGIGAGAAFGLYITATKRLARCGADTTAAAPVSVLGAGLLVSPWLLVAPDGLATPRALLLIGWLALGTAALGYLLFTRGVTRISAATTGTLSLGGPLVATVLGIALLGERPTVPAALGAALLLGGLVVVSLPARGSRYRRPAPPAVESGGIRSRSTASIASGSSGVRNGRT
ncbi:DMT family transporter [Streptomyces sp. NPDC059152]|uniref:DMT family transporter n=1 Tax=Streptomyces sp. NPDC059152 TaxID=3346742 RepID=UPI0036A96735